MGNDKTIHICETQLVFPIMLLLLYFSLVYGTRYLKGEYYHCLVHIMPHYHLGPLGNSVTQVNNNTSPNQPQQAVV